MTRNGTAWSALAGNPFRFLISAWPWRSLAYLLSGALVGFVTLVALLVTVGIGVATIPLIIGLFILGGLPMLGYVVGTVERRRLRIITGDIEIRSARPEVEGLRARLKQARREPASMRELGYAVLLGIVLWLMDIVVAGQAIILTGTTLLTPLLAHFDTVSVFHWHFTSPTEALPFAIVATPVMFVISAYVVTALAAAQGALAKMLLSPREEELERRVAELRRSRLNLVDAFETERQRIERDLHDGVQQRLVGLTMLLGRAELDVPEGEGLDLVRRAHRETEAALADLREAVRGIHPRVLIDHGLAAAVREVADRMPIPVAVDITLASRLPAHVEAAAYFVVSEGLTNVAKHAQARSAAIRAWVHEDRLELTVSDDGIGGAAIGSGSGLSGLVTRLDALGGTLAVTSPEGGPTQIRMECPCAIES
jgi:signal transduction histidine kinase